MINKDYLVISPDMVHIHLFITLDDLDKLVTDETELQDGLPNLVRKKLGLGVAPQG